MPHVIRTTDRSALATFFRRDPLLHLYELGDLDPFFWPACRWHALASDAGDLTAVVLEYACPLSPTVLALGREGDEDLEKLLAAVEPSLPARFYAHLSPNLAEVLGGRQRERKGQHLKMALADRTALENADVSGTVQLSPEDLEEVQSFFARAYPHNYSVQLRSKAIAGTRHATDPLNVRCASLTRTQPVLTMWTFTSSNSRVTTAGTSGCGKTPDGAGGKQAWSRR